MSGPSFDPDFEAHEKFGNADALWAIAFLLAIFGALIACYFAYVASQSAAATATLFVFELFALGLVFWNWSVLEHKHIELREEGLHGPIWRKSRSLLIKEDGYDVLGGYLGFEVLSRKLPESLDSYDASRVILLKDEFPVSVSDVIRIHDQANWDRSSSETLSLNANKITLSSIFEQVELRNKVSSIQIAESDFVSIGLVSNDLETNDENNAERLSRERAQHLGDALLDHGKVNRDALTRFHAVGLGWSTVYADANTDDLRKQRPAIVLGIIRRHSVMEELPLKKVLEAIIQNIQVGTVLLKRYKYSDDVASRLEGSTIDFKGRL